MVDELFACVWPFYGVATYRVNCISICPKIDCINVRYCLPPWICLSICLCLSFIYLLICPFVSMSNCLSVRLTFYIRVSLCMSVHIYSSLLDLSISFRLCKRFYSATSTLFYMVVSKQLMSICLYTNIFKMNSRLWLRYCLDISVCLAVMFSWIYM